VLAGEEVAYDEARHADLRRLIAELEPLAREAARQAGMAIRMILRTLLSMQPNRG